MKNAAIKRLYLPAEFALCKDTGATNGAGGLEGYASVFNNIDLQGDVIRRGAYTKTINERINTGKVRLMLTHIGYAHKATDVIGTIRSAVEDEHGLKITAEYASTPAAQDVRTLVREGHVDGLSVAIQPIRMAQTLIDTKQANEIMEAKLIEITVTAFPANEETHITNSKSYIEDYAEIVAEICGESEPKAREEKARRFHAELFKNLTVQQVDIFIDTLAAISKPMITEKAADHSFEIRTAQAKQRLMKLLGGVYENIEGTRQRSTSNNQRA
jgi:HK97 family phage prohead protease